jgi:hypothetical protein
MTFDTSEPTESTFIVTGPDGSDHFVIQASSPEQAGALALEALKTEAGEPTAQEWIEGGWPSTSSVTEVPSRVHVIE